MKAQKSKKEQRKRWKSYHKEGRKYYAIQKRLKRVLKRYPNDKATIEILEKKLEK